MVSNNRIRRLVNVISNDYYVKNQEQELTDLVRAWKGICDISKEHPNAWNSFFKIGGMHGEPFRGAGYANAAWRECHHGNLLFPTWHRAYCFHIENALRSIPGCSNATLPYWDEAGEDTKVIDNPLHSCTFPQNIIDRVDQDHENEETYNLYPKLKGYKTVRYPYSGLVGTEKARVTTKKHNAKFSPDLGAKLLNDNVKDWLNAGIMMKGKFHATGTRTKFTNCLHAPNYTVFSNATSAQAWNDNAYSKGHIVPLESPHNDIHLAVGGWQTGHNDYSPISGANGDMGENDTAGLDPIFFFHHCEMDRYFWLWQQKHQSTKTLKIIPEYPGTSSADGQGPTPGIPGGVWLTLDTEPHPFTKPSENGKVTYFTSRDVIDIQAMGYKYDTISKSFLDALPPTQHTETSVRMFNVDKNQIAGSHQFRVYVWFKGEEKRKLVAVESVLSRWHMSSCANCQLSADVQGYAPLHGITDEDLNSGEVDVVVDLITWEKLNAGDDLHRSDLLPMWEEMGKNKKFLS